jgi:hypothetical protein
VVRVSRSGDVADAVLAVVTSVVSGVQTDRGNRLIDNIPETPFCFSYGVTETAEERAVGMQTDWIGNVGFVLVHTFTSDDPEANEAQMLEWQDGIRSGILADMTLGGVCERADMSLTRLDEFPDKPRYTLDFLVSAQVTL